VPVIVLVVFLWFFCQTLYPSVYNIYIYIYNIRICDRHVYVYSRRLVTFVLADLCLGGLQS